MVSPCEFFGGSYSRATTLHSLGDVDAEIPAPFVGGASPKVPDARAKLALHNDGPRDPFEPAHMLPNLSEQMRRHYAEIEQAWGTMSPARAAIIAGVLRGLDEAGVE